MVSLRRILGLTSLIVLSLISAALIWQGRILSNRLPYQGIRLPESFLENARIVSFDALSGKAHQRLTSHGSNTITKKKNSCMESTVQAFPLGF